MKLNILLQISSLLALGSASSYCPSTPANHSVQTKIFHEFVQKFYIDKDPKTAFLDHVDVNYIQHNPNALSGRDNAIAFLEPLIPTTNMTLMHVAFMNNTGYAHFRQDAPGQLPDAIVDILRFNGSCIVEHWDVIQARPVNATNPLAMW